MRFRRPDGRVIVEAPPLPPVPAASPAALTAWWRHEGIADDGEASLPSWDGGTVDYGWAVDSLRQAAVTP